MTPNESDVPTNENKNEPGWLSKLMGVKEKEKAPETVESDMPKPQEPQQKMMGGFPWDKVFLELFQRGIDLKMEVNAKEKNLSLTATFTDEKGDTRHVSTSGFDFKTHMDEYEKFWQHAVTELAPDRL